MLEFHKLTADYQQALLRQVIPFWLINSPDRLCGGYFDLLGAAGMPIDADKHVALQAEQTWAFAWLYTTFDGQPRWLEHARHGGAFLSRFAHDDTLRCYADLDRRGRPVAAATTQAPNVYTLMAYAQLYRATQEDEWAMLAKALLTDTLAWHDTYRDEPNVSTLSSRPVRHLREWALVFRAVLSMQPLLDEESWKDMAAGLVEEIQTVFADRRTDTLRTMALPDGGYVNTPDGRQIDVGLTLQLITYLLDYCALVPNRKLTRQVAGWCLWLCEQAWEPAAGGLVRYIDHKGLPLIWPDTGERWAWVALEGLSALLKSYHHTRQPDCLKWFRRIHDYVFAHFPDSKAPGWFPVIDAQRVPMLALKALPSVGCYSQIRCLTEISQLLGRYAT